MRKKNYLQLIWRIVEYLFADWGRVLREHNEWRQNYIKKHIIDPFPENDICQWEF